MAKVEFKEYVKNYDDLVGALKFVKENYVLVGIPDAQTDRGRDAEITNAELLFIHTNGSPINNIPPRPVIEQAILSEKDKFDEMLKKVYDYARKGDKQSAVMQLRRVGLKAQNVCRGWFVNPNNGWPPNAPSTAAAKIRRYKKSHKGKAGTYTPKPLIDTGELRKSITYVLSLRGRRQL